MVVLKRGGGDKKEIGVLLLITDGWMDGKAISLKRKGKKEPPWLLACTKGGTVVDRDAYTTRRALSL